jgi:hypothetical protein
VVAALYGDGLRADVRASAGRSSFAEHEAVAFLETGQGVRRGEVYVVAVALGRSAEAAGPAPEATVDGGRIVVGWPDGHSDELVLEGNTETRELPKE